MRHARAAALCVSLASLPSSLGYLAAAPRVIRPALPFCRLFASSPLPAARRASTTMASARCQLEIEQFPCLSDNYGFLVHDVASGQTAAIDTPDAKAYLDALDRRGWKLTHILNTHHHYDHTGANLELKGKGVTSELDFCHCFVFYFPLLNGCHGSVHVVTLIIRGFDALPFSPTSPPSYPQIDQLSDR